MSRSRFEKQWSLWSKELPGIQPYYAVKCNPDPQLISWIHEKGGAFDCASTREMKIVHENLGKSFQADKILFANPCKTPSDIQTASKLGITHVTADSAEEMNKMYMSIYRPQTLIRVSVDDSGSACPFSMKFGIEPEKIEEVLKEAALCCIPVVGLSFHVGSGSKHSDAFANAIQRCSDVWASIQKRGFVGPLSILDIGGGWSHCPSQFEEQAKNTRKALEDIVVKPKRVIAEPGRFFAAPTHGLYVRVMGKKPAIKGKGFRYTLDESIYGQFSCIPFDHAMPRMARLRGAHDGPRRNLPATFFGRTCDSLDWIGASESTEELFVGDWLYVPDMGAYTTATSTEFNGFPRPVVELSDAEPEADDVVWLNGMKYPLASMLNVG